MGLQIETISGLQISMKNIFCLTSHGIPLFKSIPSPFALYHKGYLLNLTPQGNSTTTDDIIG